MANLFQKIGAYGGFGGFPGAYMTNKKFRGGVNTFLFGKDPSLDQISNFDPAQQQIWKKLTDLLGGEGGGLESAMANLQQYLDPNSQAYKDFEAPYLTEFNEQTLPGIAEQFAGGAGGGALSSSAFGQALGGAASQYKSNLAGLKSQLGRQAAKEMLGLTQFGLQAEPFSYYENPGKKGHGAEILAAIIKAMSGGG